MAVAERSLFSATILNVLNALSDTDVTMDSELSDLGGVDTSLVEGVFARAA
jgi:hypothetical protein